MARSERVSTANTTADTTADITARAPLRIVDDALRDAALDHQPRRHTCYTTRTTPHHATPHLATPRHQHRQVTGSVDKLKGLSQLSVLMLSGTKVTGDISAFSECPELEIVSLNDTKLTGVLEEAFGNAPKLEVTQPSPPPPSPPHCHAHVSILAISP